MPRSGRYALCSLNASRPFCTPPEITGRRREDPACRCPQCRHHMRYAGLTPSGEVVTLDACRHFMRELLIAKPKTRLCGAFSAV